MTTNVSGLGSVTRNFISTTTVKPEIYLAH